MMKRSFIPLIALTVVACGPQQNDASRRHGYVSGPLPTAAAVQEQATLAVGVAHEPAEPFGETEEERKYFEQIRSSLEQGYGGTFQQLAGYLDDQ